MHESLKMTVISCLPLGSFASFDWFNFIRLSRHTLFYSRNTFTHNHAGLKRAEIDEITVNISPCVNVCISVCGQSVMGTWRILLVSTCVWRLLEWVKLGAVVSKSRSKNWSRVRSLRIYAWRIAHICPFEYWRGVYVYTSDRGHGNSRDEKRLGNVLEKVQTHFCAHLN